MDDDFAKRLNGFDKVWKRVNAGRKNIGRSMGSKGANTAYAKNPDSRGAAAPYGRSTGSGVNTDAVCGRTPGGSYNLKPRNNPGSSATRYGMWPYR